MESKNIECSTELSELPQRWLWRFRFWDFRPSSSVSYTLPGSADRISQFKNTLTNSLRRKGEAIVVARGKPIFDGNECVVVDFFDEHTIAAGAEISLWAFQGTLRASLDVYSPRVLKTVSRMLIWYPVGFFIGVGAAALLLWRYRKGFNTLVRHAEANVLLDGCLGLCALLVAVLAVRWVVRSSWRLATAENIMPDTTDAERLRVLVSTEIEATARSFNLEINKTEDLN